ncbi:MAG: proline racemase family protein [Ornithinimicrobium sp.]|uniref:proline racemase family protein n=1 Tax=Ornithinimicrobium sp. TaxID=1977084 RepID=UPI0026E10991|nr:proline racemase family protein [Ornithinimicrobium sp.]MDO5739795.1 proline racemase family protein [Ornithinimicrobium sp.]
MTTHTESYTVEDYHTGGEPFRIVADHDLDLRGSTVAERRVHAMSSETVGRVRQLLCFEPRGHADMYGGFITPPNDDGAHFGVLFWHKDGFSTACGHGTIALGVWAVDSGRVSAPDTGQTDVVIDVPSGRVTARVRTEQGRVVSVDFVNVPSYLLATSVPVNTSRGPLVVDVSYGGAIYAQLDVSTVGLSIVPDQFGELIALGREIKWALNEADVAKHPVDDRLSGIYGTIIFEELPGAGRDGELAQRNATIFADGELDRSPCGSGTCARLATLSAAGRLGDDDTLVHGSIVGSTFTARVMGREQVAGRDAVVPVVTGMAYRTGESRFTVDPRDPLVPGFTLR